MLHESSIPFKFYELTRLVDSIEWSSITSEFDLVCSRKSISATLSTFGMVGMLIGAALAGTFADKFGRKKSIYIWVLAASVSLICHSFVTNLTLNTIFRTLEMAIAHMVWIPHISYCVEIVGPKEGLLFQFSESRCSK